MAAPEAADVVVVGAGVAGLYAAHLLRQSAPALKTIVLEAGARSGGRILTLENFAPWPVDLGGEFVHGEVCVCVCVCVCVRELYHSTPAFQPSAHWRRHSDGGGHPDNGRWFRDVKLESPLRAPPPAICIYL